MKRWTNGLPGVTGCHDGPFGLSLSSVLDARGYPCWPGATAPHLRPNTLMQHLTFVASEICLATRGRAIHDWHDKQPLFVQLLLLAGWISSAAMVVIVFTTL